VKENNRGIISSKYPTKEQKRRAKYMKTISKRIKKYGRVYKYTIEEV